MIISAASQFVEFDILTKCLQLLPAMSQSLEQKLFFRNIENYLNCILMFPERAAWAKI